MATLALTGIAYFLIADAALYFLNPGYELIRASAGDYDVKSLGLLAASAFWGLGLGSLALTIGLYQGASRSRRSWMGLLLLGIWGIGMFIAGVFPASDGGSTVTHMTTVRLAGMFPVQVEANPDTAFGWIHLLDMLGSFLLLSIAAVRLSWQFKQDENWHPIYRMELILAVVMCVASILFWPALLFPGLSGYTGLGPVIFMRLGLVIGILWLLVAATRLRFVLTRPISE